MAKVKCQHCAEVPHQTNDNYNPCVIPKGNMFELIPGTIPYENLWSTFSDESDFGQALPCPYCDQPYADPDGYIRTIQFDYDEKEKYAEQMLKAGMPTQFICEILQVDAIRKRYKLDQETKETEETPKETSVFVCPFCVEPRQFSREAYLKSHIVRSHKDNDSVCKADL